MRISLLALLCLSACAPIRAVPLETMVLKHGAPVAVRSDRTFVVARFVDSRGPDFAHHSASNFIPVVHWLHQGFDLAYPEHGGVMTFGSHGVYGVATGSLDIALTRLLAAEIRDLGLAAHTTTSVDPSLIPPRDHETDYVISGRLVRSVYKQEQIPILGIALGMLGVPFIFTKFHLEFEVYLFRAGFPDQPLWHQTYRHASKATGGFYYNRAPGYRMVEEALEATLPTVVADLAQVVAADSSPQAPR